MLALRPYDPFRKAEELGAMWTLHKGARTATCKLGTHPLGWELVVTLDREMVQTQVCKFERDVLDTSETWRAVWESKGWAST